jgi:two-component system chemotaxis sensor kinase CheA
VVKSLENNLHAVPGISGATILGDGGVSLILDVAALIRSSRQLADESIYSQ